MTQNNPLISRWGANSILLLLLFFFPNFSYSNANFDSGCCDEHDYWIKFPKDAVANCEYPDADDIEVGEGYCDLLAISKEDKKFIVPGSSNCYKIFRTYSVVNWCEYVDGSDPVVVSRDEDCDGKPGDEDLYVSVKTRYGNDPCDYDHYGYYYHSTKYEHVCYDRTLNPYDENPASGTKGESCDYESNPNGFWKEITDIHDDGEYFRDHCEIASVGFWQYTQMIKVTDYDAPSIDYSPNEPFCSYSSDKENECPGLVSLSFSIHEDCSPQDVTVSVFFDKYADGSLDEEVTDWLSGHYPYYEVDGYFPLGDHALKVMADDGCGNVGWERIPFEVEDCKGPSPICINGLSIKLMPVIPAADADGDGDTDEGAMTLWASDFVASPTDDCSGPVHYSINKVGEAVDQYETGLTLTCDDKVMTLVEIHAWDAYWNNDFCVTYVQVQRGDELCPEEEAWQVGNEEEEAAAEEEEDDDGDTAYGKLAGQIITEYEMPVGGVMVHRMVEEIEEDHLLSDMLGNYSFEDVDKGGAHMLKPEANTDWLSGITISDLFVLKKYLLGIIELDSPYKMLAADLNASGDITDEDMDLLWTLFLKQAEALEFTNAWEFVPKAYEFPDPSNPWAEEIPRSILIDEMQESREDLDFVAVKMGDLDESMAPGDAARTTNGQFSFQLRDAQLSPGETHRIEITAKDLARLQAYQATFAFNPSQLELLNIHHGLTYHFGMKSLDDGLLYAAWHRPLKFEQESVSNKVLFSLDVRAKQSLQLSEVLYLSTRGLHTEAIGTADEVLDLALEFNAEQISPDHFSVAQNTPNPFMERTQIRYLLPQADEVNLRISDLNGRILKEIRTAGQAGENIIELSDDSWPAGVLFYTLKTGEFSITKKMVLVK